MGATADGPEPRARLAALCRRPEAEIPLAEAALLIAAEEYAGLDIPGWLGHLDALAGRAAARIGATMDVEATAAALNRLLFEEEQFRGNDQDYYDPRNSFLNEVLARHLGIPITLSVVYLEVATRAGVRGCGIGFPGHFLVRLERQGDTRLLDPFHGGRRLTEAECQLLLQRLHGDTARLDPRHLQPVTPRQILVRMLNNLKGIYLTRRDWGRALAAMERMLLLDPDARDALRGQLRAVHQALASRN
ncbi:MAG TPA: transglutaminase-like domain-containing protein [Vicinamibacteria bacterium]|nr:transglutaminase-like domain-containing protein [Vicinamibacteria bacterium]